MRIGIAQINTRAGDFAHTAGRMEAMARAASDQGAELLLFPLATLTGPRSVDYANQEGNLLDLSDTLVRLSDELACPCVVPVVSSMEGPSFSEFPEALLLREGEVVPLRLMGLASRSRAGVGDMQEERDEFAQPTVLEFGSRRLGVCFSYDGLDAFASSSDAVDAVLFFSGYGYALDDPASAMGASLAENRFRTDAGMLDAWLVGIASVGGYGTQVFAGSSFVLSPAGELVASAPAFEESLVVCDVCVPASEVTTPLFEPEIYNRSLHLWEALSLGLHDYLAKTERTDVALVLDGSLASCLLATLASDALGPRHVHALVGEGKNAGIARALADALRVRRIEADFPWEGVEDEDVLADLLQVRLAAFARESGALPLLAHDKTHLALEATVATCGVGGLLPLGDVYRTDLIELAHMRNTISPVIPGAAFDAFEVPDLEGLADAEPTPAMRLQRVDVLLSTHIEWERPITDVVARQGSERLALAVLARLRQTEEARLSRLPYLVMSSRTLYDARMPLGYAWRDRVRSEDERVQGSALVERLGALLPDQQEPVQASMEVGELLDGISPELLAQMQLPEGVDRQALQGSLNELLGLVHDLLQGGGLSPEQGGGNPPFDGPYGPLTWGSPFSEN